MTPMPEQGLPVAKIAAEPKKAIDWERVEIDFRAGRMTLREIGAKHGVAHPSILKRAKRDSWDRDLQGKIHAKAAAIVAKKTATKQVATREPATKISPATERTVVAAEAELIAGVQSRRRERTDRLDAAFQAALAMAEKGAQDIPILMDLRRTVEMLPEEMRPGALKQIADLEEVIASDAQISRIQRLMQSGVALSETEAHVYGLSRDAPLGSVPAGLTHFYPPDQELPEPRL